MGKKKKTIKTNFNPQGKQVKQVQNPQEFYEKFPAWSFSFCDVKHQRWGLYSQSATDLKAVFEYIRALEKMGSWGKVLRITSGRSKNTRNHSIAVSDINKDAQNRLEEMNFQEDVLFSIALGATQRLWGIMDQGVFRVIWFDPNHEIYVCHKKHT